MSDHELHGCELLERIGEGGIADVFRARWSGREVALKVLRDTDRASMRKRFLREGRLLQRLDHPGLVRCLHVFEAEPPALVLELLQGLSLDQQILRRPLDAEEAMHLATASLRVLQYLHEQGIIHRDVKASNIFCASDNRTVMMDLGLAADPADPLTTTLGDVLGTYAYMAPEQIAGAESDHRCDLYSLGVTLYEAICGTRPYAARGAAGWLAAHRGGTATPLVEVASGLPVRLAGLVDRLMARDPLARPPSAAVALAMLTGVWGVRRALHPPPLIAREGVRGAVEAVLDAAGAIVVTGADGSGLGSIPRMVQTLATENHVETITLRARHRMTEADVLERFAAEIARFGLPSLQLLDALRRHLAELAAEGPLLLLVEDADALGPEAFRTMIALALTPGLSTVIVGIDLPPVERARHLSLRPLTLAEVRQLVSGMLASPAVPPGLDLALYDASGGLAGTVVGLVREQAENSTLWCEGASESGHAAWRWDAAAGLVPGATTRRALQRTLRRLTPLARQVLELLAVADDAVPLDLVLDILGAEPSGLDLGPLVRQGLAHIWTEREEERIVLRRAVVQRLILEGLSDEARSRLHGALADGVSRRPRGEWETRFALLHAALGRPDAEGVERLVSLAEHLAAFGRPVRALRVVEHLTDSPLLSAMLAARRAYARAVALRSAGRLVESRDALAAAAALARGAGTLDVDPLELELMVAMGAAPSEALVQRVWERTGRGEAGVLLAAGDLALIRGQISTGEGLFVAAAAASGSPIDRIACRARVAAADALLLRGASAEAESRLLGLIRELRGRDLPRLLASAYVHLAQAQRVRGQYSRALESLSLAGDTGDRQEGGSHRAAIEVVCAWARAAAGDLEGADVSLSRVGSAGTALPYEVRALYFEVLAEVRRLRGDAPAVLSAHLAGLDAARAAEDVVRVYFHEGMAGLRTANARLLSEAVTHLDDLGAHRHLAQLFLLGAVVGRDRDILAAAEARARKAGDVGLLLEVLYAGRATARRSEARTLARGILDGLHGALRDCFRDLPQARWALEEPGRSGRDTEG